MEIQFIEIGKIIPDKEQPRKKFDSENLERLKQSIKDNGIEQPIIVRPNGKDYIIIDGERRYRASHDQLKEMPCIIKTPENEIDILEYQLRTDCLKDELDVNELDRAIYKYYEYHKNVARTSSLTSSSSFKQSVLTDILKYQFHFLGV